MALLADMLLALGALGAAIYCLILSRRLARFSDLEKGMGGAIAVLSVQVDDMTKALARAQGAAKGAEENLKSLTEKADAAARRLELLLASMHGLDESESAPAEAEMAPAPEPDPPVAANVPPPSAPPEPAEDAGGLQWRTRRRVGSAVP